MKRPQFIEEFIVSNARVLFSELKRNTRYESCLIYQDHALVKCEQVCFSKCEFEMDACDRAEFLDVVFDRCDLSNHSLQKSYLYRCEFLSCKLMASEIYDSKVKDVVFKDKLMNFMNLSQSSFENVLFDGCRLNESSLMMAKYKNMKFKNCELTGLNLSDTRCNALDLTSCTFDTIVYSPSLIKGMRIRADQASALIGYLGLIID